VGSAALGRGGRELLTAVHNEFLRACAKITKANSACCRYPIM
jgi:S-methylmethionine-dependent homocysteine/selenocysteine methylase